MREYLTVDELKVLSFDAIERLQNLRFRATVRYLLPWVKAYAQLFKQYKVDPFKIDSVEDWQKQGMPLIKKSYYMKRPEDFIVKPDVVHIFGQHLKYVLAQEELGEATDLMLGIVTDATKKAIKEYYNPKMLVFSGGTEYGVPVPAVLTAEQKFGIMSNILLIVGELLMRRYFGEQRIVGMNVFPYAPHLGWHAVHMAFDLNVDFNLHTAAGGAVSSEKLVLLAHKLKPNVIAGMADYLKNRWLPLAIQRKIKLPERVMFVNGAQKMLEPERKQIEELAKKLGVKHPVVIDFYGVSELKEDIMAECKPGSGFHHLAPLSNIIRTVSVPEGRVKELVENWEFTEPAQGGYATCWNIDGAGTLFEGYIIGDVYDKILHTTCPHCGLHVERIFNINRIREKEAQLRLTGMVEEKVKGTRINLVAMREAALESKKVKEAQVLLRRTRKGDQLMLNFVPKDTKQAALKALKRALEMFEVKPKLVPVKFEKLIGKKLKFEAIKIESS